MLAPVYLCLVAALAYFLQFRVALLDAFKGLPRYLCSLGLTLFLVTWVNFLLWVILGWGGLYSVFSWGALFLALYFSSGSGRAPVPGSPGGLALPDFRRLLDFRQWNYWALFLAAFVLVCFYSGVDLDPDGDVWVNFNFGDTGFHLSVAQGFLAAPGFPPVDLNMYPFPLKYHFIADFHVAHLVRLGLPILSALWFMNLVSATVLVGSLWAVFERWLRLPPRWVMLAGLIFLSLNPAITNVVHFLALEPSNFDPSNPIQGILRYNYFNFEYMLYNLLEPQRALLFSMPVILLVLQAAFGGTEDSPGDASGPRAQSRVLQAFLLVCLLPLSHAVAFPIMSVSLIPALWRHRAWFFSRWLVWAPVFALGVLQLLYLTCYGPPAHPSYSSWVVPSDFPLDEFRALPAFTRRAAFWFFANGDFFGWSLLLGALALGRCARNPAEAGPAAYLRVFLGRWKWYFAVCGGFFVFINVWRYSAAWGDSNKFVLFFNLGLTLVIVLGAAQWIGGRWRVFSHALWVFFFVLCVSPVAYEYYVYILVAGHGEVLMYEKNGRKAAEWMQTAVKPSEIVLTAAYNFMNFTTTLAGRPTLAGIYGESNPYLQDQRHRQIRRIYEHGELALLRELNVRYVCISRNERLDYKLDPRWTQFMEKGTGVVFQSGGGPGDSHSVYIFDCRKLPIP